MRHDCGDGRALRLTTAAQPTSSTLVRLLLLLDILVVVFGSIVPLTPAGSWASLWASLQAGLIWHVEAPISATVSERLLAFLPMGVLAGLLMTRSRRRRALPAAAGLTAVVALAIEIGQAAMIGRHPRLSDFVLAVLFGCLGAAIGRMLPRMTATTSVSRPRPLDSPGNGKPPAFLGLVLGLLLCNGATIAALTISHSGLRIANWDCDYPLSIGNEPTEDRPWLGRIRGLAIYDRLPDPAERTKLARTPMTAEYGAARRQAGALLIYAFDAIEGRRIPNLGPTAGEEDLDGEIVGPLGKAVDDGAIGVEDRMVIRSVDAPRELCQRIVASEAIAVEVEFASGDLGQTGPARIVTMSLDPLERNFTLGQEGGALTLRVRTPRNGPNGLNLPTHTDAHAVTGGWQHVWAAHSGGRPMVELDGKAALVTADGHKLLLLEQDRPPVPVSGVVALLSFGAGTMASAVFAGRRPAMTWLIGYPLAAVAPLLCASVLQIWQGYDLDRAVLAVAIIAPYLGCIAGLILARPMAIPTG